MVAGAYRDCVIVPSAGSAERLRIPYPKELFAVGPDRALIDLALELVPSQPQIVVVVVISPEKMTTARYLAKYAASYPLAFVFQYPGLTDCIGAVLSARGWFGERNVVLLPDQLLVPAPETPDPVSAMLDVLSTEPFCFLAKQETDIDRLRADGAIRVEPDETGSLRVRNYRDKPLTGADQFNAVWAAFGFRREAADAALCVMHSSTVGKSPCAEEFSTSPLAGARALLVADCIDLGTWPAIRQSVLAAGTQV